MTRTRCVIMDNAVIEAKCVLSGCIVGRYGKIGPNSVLKVRAFPT